MFKIMAKKFDKYTVFSVIIFITAFLFWWLLHPEGLYYQEKFQLFINDAGYLAECMSLPGGLASYISEFLVQYYYYPMAGAIIVALLATSVTIATYNISRCFGNPDQEINIIHALPAIAIWYLMRQVETTPTYLVSILLSLLISWLCAHTIRSGQKLWMSLSLMLIPAGFYLIGPAIYIAAIISSACIIRHKAGIAYMAAMLIATSLVMALCVGSFMYPTARILSGLHYCKAYEPNKLLLIAIFLIAAIPLINIKPLNSNSKISNILQLAAYVISVALVAYSYNTPQNQLVKYLKLTHEGKYKEIISDAEKNTPQLSHTMVLVNQALAFEKQLCDKMFHFPQQGLGTLISPNHTNTITPLLDAEVYMNMGMTRFATMKYFESILAPPHKPYCYNYMRLAECYIITKDYEVARKYLNILRKTTFYKAKAKEYLRMIDNAESEKDPFISSIRKLNPKQNKWLLTQFSPEAFKDLIEANPENYLAYQYQMAYAMLTGNANEFMGYFNRGGNAGFQKVPRHVQEMLMMIIDRNKDKGNIDNLLKMVDQDVQANYKNKQTAGQNTFWHYQLTTEANNNKQKQQ